MSRRMLPEHALRGFWKLLKGFRKAFLVAFLSMAIAVSLQIVAQFFLRDIVDGIRTNPEHTAILLLALGYVGLAALKGVSLFFHGRSVARASEGATRNLRNRIYDHLQKLTFAYHDNMKTGELIQRSTSDVDTIRRFFGEQIPGITRILFLFIFNFCAIMFLDWKLALISSAVTPFIVLVSAYFFGRIERSFEGYQEQDGIVSAILQENLSGMRVVRAFARQEYEKDKFETANSEKFRRGKRFLINHTVYWPVSHMMCLIQMVIGFGAGGYLAIKGTLTIGTYIAYIQMVVALIWPLQQLGRMVAQLSTAFVSYKRVREIINEQEEDLESGLGEGQIHGVLEFRDLRFAYEENSMVLKGVSFRAEKGEKIALLGEAGSGKSTLINLIPRFYDFHDGEILLDGKGLRSYSRHYLRRNIGIVEQEPFLFSATIRENICYGVERTVRQDEVEAAAKAASIHDSILSFPDRYDTLVGEKGVTLSGGQKQRIAIARTLLKDPRILILDDSTSAVDAETEENIRDCLQVLMRDRTSFIVAHRIQSLMDADRILVFKDGRIIQEGTHETLINEPGFYKKVFELQTRIEEELDKEIHYA
ncbi:MAG: ABC transporter ATP-binding protein [Spirochaetales bacterium]|nr:ABC transporter ATP-binding protein [Spirochaetales bacterium]